MKTIASRDNPRFKQLRRWATQARVRRSDNILLLEGSGLPVVLDFGAARRVITDKTQAITVILKPGYAPIEQYAEVPDMAQGAWTDVYALCAVMHVAITGRSPPPSVARLLNDGYQPLAGWRIAAVHTHHNWLRLQLKRSQPGNQG